MKKLLMMLMMVTLAAHVIAQETKTVKKTKKEERRMRISAIAKQEEEGVIKYKKHTAIGGKLTTDGYGGFIEISRAQSVRKALLFQLDISERKHLKEIKQSNIYDIYNTTSPLIYGKINFFYPIRLGVQQQFLLGNKGNKNGVSITANGGGGLIAGLLRPYLVEVQKSSGAASEFVKYDPTDTAAYFLNGPYIGGPNLGTGWSQMKVTPGLYAKAAVRFDFGKYNEMVNALEVGVTGEFYAKKIPQMVFNKEKQSFFSAYVAIVFGKRK